MPKTTVYGGGVNALAEGEVEAVADTEKRKTKARSAAARKGARDKQVKKGASSPGISSEPSTKKPASASEKKPADDPKPAQKTELPLKKTTGGGSTAGFVGLFGEGKK